MPSIATDKAKLWLDGQEIQAARLYLNYDQQWIDVRTAIQPMKPDLAWIFTDAASHFHAYTSQGELPTLVEAARLLGAYDDDLPEYEYYFACRLCEEEITPGLVPDYSAPDRVPGRLTWSLEVTLGVATLRDQGGLEDRKVYSVRYAAYGRTVFGFAQAHLEYIDLDAGNGQTARYNLVGASELGERDG